MKNLSSIINQRTLLLSLTNIVIIAILLIGLITISSVYSASATTASTTTKPARIIPGDSSQFVEHEGLAPEPEPWEDGMRTDPTPNTFEWWYFDGIFDDGSHAEITFLTKPWNESPLPMDPYIAFTVTNPNGTVFHDRIDISTDQFLAARGQTNVTMGKNWVRGNLTNYKLHAESDRGFGADLSFTREAPSSRGGGGSGKFYFDPSLTQYIGWFIAQPSASVQGNLTYGGQTYQVQESGYHDHNWGTFDFNKVLDRWYWTRADFGNYTLDAGLQIASEFYDYQPMPAFYLAKGNQALIEDMHGLKVQGSGNNTSPGGYNYPSQLIFNWQNGTDTVRLTLSDPKLIASGSSTAITNATVIGHPEYMRISGNGELNVNVAGTNETESGPIIWEVNYGH
jgi:CrtC N-terminal lipocalin domain